MMNAPKIPLLVGLILLVATGYAYIQFFSVPSDAPVAHYEKAYGSIQKDLQSNDIVLIHPTWRDDVVSALSQMSSGNAGPQITSTLPEAAGEFGELIVIADPNAPPLSQRLKKMRFTQATNIENGAHIFTLKKKNGSTSAQLNFINLLPQAQVQVKDKDGKKTTCKWSSKSRKFKCPKLPKWMYVGPYKMKSGKDEKRCIWSHPISKGEVRIRFPKPPLKSTLIFEHAFSNSAARSSNKSPVTVTLKKDKETLTHLSQQRKPGFSRSTLIVAQPAAQHLDVIVRTENDGAGHYCFNLMTQTGEAQP
tara:strand:+ start:212 stop:1129 length:918 start_codon:yes stop_codon:yes gene_type:complete